MRIQTTTRAALAALLLLAAGCADTADIDNKTVAEVKPAAVEAAPAEVAPAEAAPAEVASGWNLVAAESHIQFLGAKVTRTHKGGFDAFTGAVVLDGTTPTGASFSADMNTLWAEQQGATDGSMAFKLTKHLKSPDFFNVAAHPTATFTSTSVKPHDAPGQFQVTGNLTMVGKTNEVSFPATIAVTEGRIEATADFQFNRQSWGIVYPGAPDDLIKDEVALALKFVFTK